MSIVTKWKSNLLVDSSIPICLGGWHTADPPARAFPVSLLLPSSPLSSTKFRGLGWKKWKEYLNKLLLKQSILPINLMNIERNGYKDPIFWYTSYNTTGSIKAFTTHPHPSWSDSNNLHICAYLQTKNQYEPHTECYRMQHLSII